MNSDVTILCAGDFSPRDLLADQIEQEKFASIFDHVRQQVSVADYAIVNLEAPVINRDSAKPIAKIGPNLHCSPKAIDALVYAGFNMVTLANNHFYDFGDTGVSDTLEACQGKLDVIGGGLCLRDASQPVRKTIKQRTFTFINCCEHEYSIATPHSGGSNPLNPFVVFKQIQEAKEKNDKIIVIVHGGREWFQYPTPRMKETYRFFIDAGADVVINHHQHCYCGYEEYKKGLIFYGLGNFCFYHKQYTDDLWNYGYFVELFFEENTNSYKIRPYKQCSDKMGVFMLADEELDRFTKHLEDLSSAIQDDELLTSKLNDFITWPAKDPLVVFEPYSYRVLAALRRRRLLPSFVSQKKKEHIKAKLLCESHRDCIMAALTKKTKK